MKTLLVHRSMLYREGLRYLLCQADKDLDIIEAGSFNQMLNLSDMHSDLSLVLLSLELSDPRGLEALSTLHRRRPSLPIVVLCESDDKNSVARFSAAGARGVITESANRTALAGALGAVLAGDIAPPQVKPLALPALMHTPRSIPHGKSASINLKHEPASEPSGRRCYLSPRQLDVLALIERGKSNKEIARQLRLSEATVKTYCLIIYRELGVINRTQAAVKSRQLLLDKKDYSDRSALSV